MRIEAPSLQEAFAKAADELNCSVTELEIKVLQHPRAGFFGLFKKPAIIEVAREAKAKFDSSKRHENRKKDHKEHPQDPNRQVEQNSKKSKQKKKEQKQPLVKPQEEKGFENFFKDDVSYDTLETENEPNKDDKILNKEPKTAKPKYQEHQKSRHKERLIIDNSIIDTFNQVKPVQEIKAPPSTQILEEIKQKLIYLFSVSDFEIDIVEVFVYDDDTIQINLDGADAALLIGKEGHRYKALSYILFNWINLKYNYSLRLEIAQFLKAQEDSARQYAQVLAQKVHENGRVQSRVIDGVGLRVILEELRIMFPNKYVGVKNISEGKCVVVNDFHRK